MRKRIRRWWHHVTIREYQAGLEDGLLVGEYLERHRVLNIVHDLFRDMPGQYHVSNAEALGRFISDEVTKGQQND